MAEFKLGRIRFVWKGTWTTGASYLIDDVVSNGGKSYICVVNHTAAGLFNTDLDFVPSKWNIVSDGTQWLGDWEPETYYNPGAAVKYGGLVYICKTGHTSATYELPDFLGLEDDILKWELFAESFDWKGPWDTEIRYRINDFVSYGGTVYVCTTGHLSDASATAGLEVDSSNWDIFNQGVTFLGDWSGSTVRYKENDLVKFGANLWICTDYHTSSASFDQTKWSIFVEGFEFENSWNNSTNYQPGDVVTYGGYSYIAKTININKQPTSYSADWGVFTTGFNFVGEYNALTNYKVGDVVRNGSYTYVAVLDSLGQAVTSGTYWSLLNSGFRWTNTPQTYTEVASVTTVGTGAGAKFNVIRSGTVYIVSVAGGFAGSGYFATDQVKILGSLVGGISPANDITINILTVSGGGVATINSSGGSSTWTTSISYVFGDTVYFGANSYVCVANHTASTPNRPDNDTTGTYWNLLAAGSEYNILTTTGDMVYYGTNGPTRLPVGFDGQVLRSQNGFPIWANYGLINNLVYVGPLGKDIAYPDAGATIDQPWKSVRFATKQIEEGYLTPNAKTILATNKQFIMKEITNWVVYTYTVDITAADDSSDRFTCNSTSNLILNMPIEFTGTLGGVTAGVTYFVKTIVGSEFSISEIAGGSTKQLVAGTGSMTGTLSYDHDFCERDVGLIVEAIKYDVSHGGNMKTTAAARAYFTTAGNTYINSNFGAQKIQTVAAYTYLAELFDNVLNNVPFRNYQVFNGITDGIIQIVDTSLTAETGVVTKVYDLISIITDAITVGSATAIPPSTNPATTISVKTGTFDEVLPMVIPEYTAVVGDELRSTIIQPAAANPLLVNDTEKTTTALNRINSIASDLIQNITISPTSGNTEVQQYVTGFKGDPVLTTAVDDRATDIDDILVGGLSSIPALIIPDPVGYDSAYADARDMLVSNKAFLQQEVSAWIASRIAGNFVPFVGFVYSGTGQTKCERDVGYIVDALRYDLTYGGNLETLVAARSFYSFGTFVETGEKDQALAVYNYLKSIIGYIAEGDNGSWTKTPSNPLNQDDSLNPGSAAAGVFLEERLQEIIDTIDTGTVPNAIEPSTSWVDSDNVAAKAAIQTLKAGIQAGAIEYISTSYPSLIYDTVVCYRDVGYIVDAISYDIMFGGNFRSIKAGMSYYRGTTSTEVVIDDQLPQTQATIAYINTALQQITAGSAGSVGSATAVSRVETSANIMWDIVSSGVGSVPTLALPNPTGYGAALTDTAYAVTGNATGATATYDYARAQIVQNYAFIKDEVAQYLNVNYNSVWVGLGATGQAGCARDIGYILDGIRYDITYGGNTQSLITGSAYYSNYSLTIELGEITATVAAYTRLQTIIGQVATKTSVTVTPGNLTPQITAGSAGNAYSALFAQDRVQDIIDWINNGTGNTQVKPALTWASSDLQTAYAALQAKKTEIQSDVVWWVYKNHQDLNFNEDICSRDSGYLVDALSYDVITGSNFAAITAGRAYTRATTSALIVSTVQRTAELGAINFLKYKAKHIAAVGAVAQVDALITDITGYINGGSIPRVQWTNPSTITSAYAAATVLLRDNAPFIQAEITAWIDVQIAANTAGFVGLQFSRAACERDVGLIVEALVYDLTYGYGVGNIGKIATLIAGKAYYSALTSVLQIDSGDSTATIAAYNRLKSVAQSVVQDTAVTPSAGNAVSQVRAVTGQTVGSAATATSVGTLVDAITSIITNGLTTGVPQITISAVAGGTTFTSGTHNLAVGDVVIPQSTPTTGNGGFGLVSGTRYYVASTPLGTTFTLAAYQGGSAITTFTNGTGLSLLVEINNLPSRSWVTAAYVTQNNSLQTNKATIKGQVTSFITENYPTLSYDAATCERDVGYIIDYVGYDMMFDSNYLTITSAKSYYRAQASLVLGEQKAATIASFRYLKTLMLAVVEDNATVKRRVKVLMDIIINTLINGIGSTPEVTGTITYKNDVGLYKGAEVLKANKNFLAAEATAWITQNYGGTVTSVTATTDRFTTSSAHNLTAGDPVIFSGTVISGSAILVNEIYYVVATPTPTTFTIAESAISASVHNVTADGTGSMTVRYAFDDTLCKRDMKEYIDAMVYDLSYTGNYKSLRAAELYVNAVRGSKQQNMFYVSNATGLRNCTLNGLNGTLSEENDYGTKRPTAGAYVSLNPGFGPNDSNVWVNTRSHYSQNVSLFGTGCTGAKIDGALHAGGNRSMVKNDFTTIMSDGFGVWCTGANSLTELVSVFNYYGYAGYMAELGGRIRATNGNSSYGTYGVIAEGTDTFEQPIYAVVDNHAQQAVVTDTITDSANIIYRIEFSNAGTNYTNADIAIGGDGVNATTIGDEFRDGGVFETRIIDLDDGNGYGGTNYANALNAAQGGDVGYITIAATDIALSTAYVGMRVQISAGTGVGQYANILTYNSGTKIATIYKDSFTALTVSTTTDTGDFVNVASNATLYADMPIYFVGTTFGSITANQLYYVKALTGTTQFTVYQNTTTKAQINVTGGSGTMSIYAAGWDHAVPGTTLVNSLDLSSSYKLEPRISYTAPGYTATARSIQAVAFSAATFGNNRYIAIPTSGTSTSYSLDGKTWAAGGALSASESWIDTVYGGGQGAVATAIVGGLGGDGAVFEAVMGAVNSIGAPGIDQVVSVTIIDGGFNYTSPPTIVFTPTTGGAGAIASCTVLNGKIDSITIEVNGSGYNAPPTVSAATDRVTKLNVSTWGRGYTTAPTVTISPPVSATAWSSGGAATLGTYYSYVNTGVIPSRTNYYLATASGTFSSTAPTFTSGTGSSGTYGVGLTFAATLATGTAVLTNNGVGSITIGADGGRGYTADPTVTIVDTTAKYVAIASGTIGTAYLPTSAAENAAWTAGGNLQAGFTDAAAVAYGGGLFVTVGGTNKGASAPLSALGITWTGRTLPTTSGTYSAVTYGNGIFVAITTGAQLTAYSTNATSWTQGGNLPSSTTWSSIAYGNGRFVAIATGTRSVAISLDKGINWKTVTPGLPSALTWTKIVYGQGLFVAIASGGTTVVTSSDGLNWTVRTMPGASSTWKGLAFGNVSNNPLWVAVSSTSGQNAASLNTGATALGRMKAESGTITEIRIIEPGSGYPKGTVTATTDTTNVITVNNTENLIDSQPILFNGVTAGGLVTEKLYYVIGTSIVTNTSFKVSLVAGSTTPVVLATATGLTGVYRAGPIATQTDPNKVITAAINPRTNDGVLANPSFSNRGTLYTTATTAIAGDGYADLYQPSTFISVRNLYDRPQPGANVVFSSLPTVWYKLVAVTNLLGDKGDYTANFQISPGISVLEAPIDGDTITTTIKYSQVRLTGHDFLYIGTGNQADTNYPFVDPTNASIAAQTNSSGGGRVFFTSTDQDGNFNVGGLFGVQQSTGTATLNADAFNLSGLQSLQLGEINLGVGSAVINQFSTDPYFTADSDNIVPTQRAIKAYITAQIGGGQSSLNVNTLTAGVVYVANDSISTTSGGQLNIKSKMYFTGGIDGAPVALGFFLQR
jgi:hypothetical protein